jgi:hypothetical protein
MPPGSVSVTPGLAPGALAAGAGGAAIATPAATARIEIGSRTVTDFFIDRFRSNGVRWLRMIPKQVPSKD